MNERDMLESYKEENRTTTSELVDDDLEDDGDNPRWARK